ncbi:MAG: radical SAM protein [Proteobacteria bacterium]|nr:radical SAM protein [Pseudomonadota bacterium]
MASFIPSYIQCRKNGQLHQKIRTASEKLEKCDLCPRKCGVNRRSGETGVCKTGEFAFVSSYNAHFGEESPLVGTHGSGTIFFTWCSLLCNFCQNYEISHKGHGTEVSHETLADIMLHLQKTGCHNINLVTPSHVVPQILAALDIAVPKGLRVPLVYNSSGYDCLETIRLLEGVIDIYMPDFKFWDPEVADMTCHAKDYPRAARLAIKEMHRQVGNLVSNADNIAEKGLLIRHLVLPGGLAGTKDIMNFIAEEISTDTYVNIMPQYRPCGMAHTIEGLSDYLPEEEFVEALKIAQRRGLKRLDKPLGLFRT